MHIDLFDYKLPSELIAQNPQKDRINSKLMKVNRSSGIISHHKFSDLPDLLPKESCLVFNDSKVFPARLIGKKESGGKIEVMIISQINEKTFLCMCQPGPKIGTKIYFDQNNYALVIQKSPYRFTLLFHTISTNMFDFFEHFGTTPIPPYVKSQLDEQDLRQSYQTVYAKNLGSVAAPTAGLHFDKNLIKKLVSEGFVTEYLTLHVSAGTFEPVRSTDIYSHEMHSEYIQITSATAQKLNNCKIQNKPIVAVGTTSMRTLESMTNQNGILKSGCKNTNIFIYPPYKFSYCDALITNFHLPKSTLLMLVSAFVSLPNSNTPFSSFSSSLLGKAYSEAIANDYKFFSFGDAMLIV